MSGSCAKHCSADQHSSKAQHTKIPGTTALLLPDQRGGKHTFKILVTLNTHSRPESNLKLDASDLSMLL